MNEKNPENAEYTSKMQDLNANLLITNAHATILEVAETLARDKKKSDEDSTLGKLIKGERLLPNELTQFYIKIIKDLLVSSPELHTPQVIDLTKLIIEYIWKTQVSKSEQLNDKLRDNLLGKVWMEIIRFDIVLIRQLSGLREKSGGLNDAGIEAEIKTKSLTYKIINNMSMLGLDSQNFLNGSLIENEIKNNDGVTIRDLRMISSICDLSKRSKNENKEEA